MSALVISTVPNGPLLTPSIVEPDVGDEYFGPSYWRPNSFCSDAAPNGFRIAEDSELAAAHAFSEQIMGIKLAPLWALAGAHARTEGTAWLHQCRSSDPDQGLRLTGVFLILPLNWHGEAALRTGRFGFASPRLDQLCAPGEEMAALYLWFCAGGDQEARRNIMRTTQTWLDSSCEKIRIYGRAASDEGARAFTRFQFRRLSRERSDIFILDQNR